MTKKRPKTGLLSRLAAPLANLVRRRNDDDNEVKRLAKVIATSPKEPARSLTDEAFSMAIDQLLHQDDGAFQTKLQIVSLVEFREAVGEKWARVSDKVMMIAEGVINLHLGTGNLFGRKGNDFFILVFRTCGPEEARRRALIIAQELGTRLLGDQFMGGERPQALAVELALTDAFNPDGSLNMAAVHEAVGATRAIIARDAKNDATPPPSWMRPSDVTVDKPPLRRHLLPSEGGPAVEEDDGLPPIQTGADTALAPMEDPGWKAMQVAAKAPAKAPDWTPMTTAKAAPAAVIASAPALPPNTALSLIWRPSWLAAGEVIGAYMARLQRTDSQGQPPREGVQAYPREDVGGITALDRFCIANAVKDLRASEAAGNRSTVIVPVHWLTLTSDRRSEFVAPFADLTQETRGNRVVLEVFGVPADVKPPILKLTLQAARALCREVSLRTTMTSPRAVLAADCGAAMLSLDMAELPEPERTDDVHLLGYLSTFLATASKAGLKGCLWGVRRRKVLVGAIQQGYHMVNGPALMRDIPKPAKVLPAPKARLTA